MNFEKQRPSAQDVAHLNRGASPDRNAPAKAAGARRAPAQSFRVTAASLLVGARAHLGLLAFAGTAIASLVFLFAGDGSWMFALTEDSGIGFAPDPAYWAANAGTSAVEAIVCSALAGTVFLPSPHWLYAGAFAGPSMQRTPERSRGRAEHHLGDWQLATFSPHRFPYSPSTPPPSSRLQSR